MNYKDYYKILGVEKKASQDDIKKAYRKLAVKFHPDKNPGDKKAEERFKEITEAYEVLGSPDKRKRYDQLGMNWKNFDGRQGFSGSHNFGGGNFNFEGDLGSMFGQGGGGFSDFFKQFFGDFYGHGRQGASRKAKGSDYEAELSITLEEAFSGTERIVKIGTEKLKIKLKKGFPDEKTLRIKGKGGTSKTGGQRGDLFIKAKVSKHPIFERKNNDLHCELTISAFTAILGGKVRVPTLENEKHITIPAGTDSGKTFRLKGLGMPFYEKSGFAGDLYVMIKITVPKNLQTQDSQTLLKLAQKYDNNDG